MRTRFLLAASLSLLLSSCGGNSQQNGFSSKYKEVYERPFEMMHCKLTSFLKHEGGHPYRLTAEATINADALFNKALQIAETLGYFIPSDEVGKRITDYFLATEEEGGHYYYFTCKDLRKEHQEQLWQLHFSPKASCITFFKARNDYVSYCFDGQPGEAFKYIEETVKDEPFELDTINLAEKT